MWNWNLSYLFDIAVIYREGSPEKDSYPYQKLELLVKISRTFSFDTPCPMNLSFWLFTESSFQDHNNFAYIC